MVRNGCLWRIRSRVGLVMRVMMVIVHGVRGRCHAVHATAAADAAAGGSVVVAGRAGVVSRGCRPRAVRCSWNEEKENQKGMMDDPRDRPEWPDVIYPVRVGRRVCIGVGGGG